MAMIDDTGRFEQLADDNMATLREKLGQLVLRAGEHVTLKGREFVVDAISDETVTLRPVRQAPAGGRTLPGAIPSTRVPYAG